MKNLRKLRFFGVIFVLAILCSFSNADQNNDGLINDLVNDFMKDISDENYDAPTDSGKNITDLEIVSTYIDSKNV